MFVENLLGDLIKLRKPIIQDSKYLGIGVGLSTGKEVEYIHSVEFEENYTNLQNDNQTIYWSIENKENSQYIGMVSVHANTLKQSEIHISLSKPNYKGKEISTETISLILNYLKYKAKISEVIINIENKNHVMIRLLESLNFTIQSKNTDFITFITSI